jgi:hypothetical protein
MGPGGVFAARQRAVGADADHCNAVVPRVGPNACWYVMIAGNQPPCWCAQIVPKVRAPGCTTTHEHARFGIRPISGQ